MIDVAPLIGDIPTTEVTVRSHGASTVNAYGESTASVTDSTRDVVVHPATTAALERLPEADRLRETIAVYSTSALSTTSSTKPDLVYYESDWYEIVESEDYNTLGGMYITLAQRLEDQPSAP